LEVKDIKASFHLEPDVFNDALSGFDWSQPNNPNVTMNDGCSLISLGAAIEVWKGLGQSGQVPSIFQARVNGAKGIWIRSAENSTATARDRDIWIEINESQRKFAPHAVDYHGNQAFEPLRWSFEVLGWSRKASSATLHQSFIPILADRGVPREVIEQLMAKSLEDGRNEIICAMHDLVTLRGWLGKNMKSTTQSDTLMTRGALPATYVGRAIYMLEHGIEPSTNRFLAELLYDIFWSHFSRVTKSFAVPLAQSTIVRGIADHTGTLKPGEIHLAFSSSFMTNENEKGYFLNKQEILVSRHPCLRPSDIQKVVTKYTMELSHIRDVVVFSSLGPIPLASKLQGGDYDGDHFWVR
jgi:hypothetical protein